MDPLCSFPEFSDDWYCDEMFDKNEDEKLRKEIEELLGEDYKQDEDEGEEEVEKESTTCKQYGAGKVLKYGVGKVLKAPLIKKLGEDEDEDDESKADSPKKKRRLAELSKEEYESKMRATQANLRQSYQQTLPKRHSKFVDVRDVEPSKKSAGAYNNMNPRKKPSTTGTVQQRITRKLQALKSKKATR